MVAVPYPPRTHECSMWCSPLNLAQGQLDFHSLKNYHKHHVIKTCIQLLPGVNESKHASIQVHLTNHQQCMYEHRHINGMTVTISELTIK